MRLPRFASPLNGFLSVQGVWVAGALAVAMHGVVLFAPRLTLLSQHADVVAAPPVMQVRMLSAAAPVLSAPAPQAAAPAAVAPVAPNLSPPHNAKARPGPMMPQVATEAAEVPIPSQPPLQRSPVAQDVQPADTPPPTASTELPPAPDYLNGATLDPGPIPLADIVPEYPESAHLQEGLVVLRLLINEKGDLDNVAVVRSFPKGVFEEAALAAFGPAKFSPGKLLGIPVKSQVTIEVEFMPINRGSKVSGRGY